MQLVKKLNSYCPECKRPFEVSDLNGFDDFWKTYPRKKSKGQAEKAWKRLKIAPEIILAGLQRAIKSWEGREAQYIPYPATWLNGKGWEDEEEGFDSDAYLGIKK